MTYLHWMKATMQALQEVIQEVMSAVSWEANALGL